MLIRKNILYAVIGFLFFNASSSWGIGRDIKLFVPGRDTTVTIDSLITTDSLTVADSLTSVDSLAQAVVPDTVFPLQQRGALSRFDWGEIYTKDKLNKLDYRSFHDLFNTVPYGFVKNFGSFGQPHELTLYGLGYGSTDFIIDGVPINRRGNNAYDLNHIQTESIDSLEIIPLSRGFLYSTFNNPVSVNIVTMDKGAKQAYSRLRIYQAPDDEGYIDGLFNTRFSRRLNFSFDITNSNISSRYTNSAAGGWLASAKLRYMPSNSINLIANYNYARTETWLNGGVDKALLDSNYSAVDAEERFYNNLEAPVIYGTDNYGSLRYLKSKEHNFSLKTLVQFVPGLFSDFSFYYRFSLDEFRQNEYQTASYLPTYINDDKEKVFGVALKQSYITDNLNALFLLNYESQKIKDDYLKINSTESLFSMGGYVKFPMGNNYLVPRVYAKYLNYLGDSYTSFGGEFILKPHNGVTFFAGYSVNQKPYTLKEKALAPGLKYNSVDQSIEVLEIGTEYSWNSGKVSAGFTKYVNNSYPNGVLQLLSDTLTNSEIASLFLNNLSYTAYNINFIYSLWRIKFENKFTYYAGGYTEEKYLMPEYSLFSGIYYVDTLFNSNLKLKTGFNLYSTGQQSYYSYDFQLMRSFYSYEFDLSLIPLSNEIISPTYQLDFFLAGQIKDSAIIYFVFQNLTGNNYYIIPYYPQQGRSIRFGVAWEFLD